MNLKSKILVVEDDAVVGADLTKTLSEFGYIVLGPLTSGEAVLRDIESIKPDFILMDINLSGKLDGIETAERLQNQLAVPIIFLSAINDEATLQRAKLVNAYGYLIKPFDGPELISSIERTLKRFTEGKEEDKETLPVEGKFAIYEILSKLNVFEEIPKDSLEALANSCYIKEISAGKYFVHEDGEPADGFIPTSGRICIMKSSSSGKELIVTLVGPGDSYGILSSISSLSGSTSARTQVDSRCIFIPKSAWKSFLEKEPKMFKNICVELADRLNAAHILSCSLAHSRVESRILSALLALLPRFGRPSSKSTNEGRIYITRKELSELTGTTPETAIRVTKVLERQGLLDLTRPGIIKIPNIKLLEEAATN